MHLLAFIFPLLFLSNILSASEAGFSTKASEVLEDILNIDNAGYQRLIKELQQNDNESLSVDYLTHYKAFVDYLLCDDNKNYRLFADAHKKSIDGVKGCKTGWQRVFYSNMMLQYGMVELSRGNNFQGGMALYRAHKVFVSNEHDLGTSSWQLKLCGIFNVLWARIPDNMRFFTDLAGLSGDSQLGIRQLSVYNSQQKQKGLITESEIMLLYALQLFQPEEIKSSFSLDEDVIKSQSPLVKFLYSGILIRQNRGGEALSLLNGLRKSAFDTMPLLRYQHGRILLMAGNTKEAEKQLVRFVESYKGNSFKNDAFLQLARVRFIEGDRQGASQWGDKSLQHQPVSSVDRQAVDECRRMSEWNVALLQSRLYFDYGDLLSAEYWARTEVYTTTHKAEQSYRLGRIAHKEGRLKDALRYYDATIAVSHGDKRYFGPYAALFCAQIMIDAANYVAAREYLALAQSLNNGEYRQDIDRRIKLLGSDSCQK